MKPKTEEQRKKEFEALARPLMQWLAMNQHPHSKIILDSTSAELVEGVMVTSTEEYLVD